MSPTFLTSAEYRCGARTRLGCGGVIEPGTAHVAVNLVAAGVHVLFCPGCCPHDHAVSQRLVSRALAASEVPV